MAHCRGLSRPKKGCGCREQHVGPSLAKRSMAATRRPRSRSKSHSLWSAGKSSGEEGELRRKGLLFPKTSGLISRPMTLAGNGARLGLIEPIAISKPQVQCARASAAVMLPQRRWLSRWSRIMRPFVSATRPASKRFLTVAVFGELSLIIMGQHTIRLRHATKRGGCLREGVVSGGLVKTDARRAELPDPSQSLCSRRRHRATRRECRTGSIPAAQ
jgi:hypothetical protein